MSVSLIQIMIQRKRAISAISEKPLIFSQQNPIFWYNARHMGGLKDRIERGWNHPCRAYRGRPRPDWYKWGGLVLIALSLLVALSR